MLVGCAGRADVSAPREDTIPDPVVTTGPDGAGVSAPTAPVAERERVCGPMLAILASVVALPLGLVSGATEADVDALAAATSALTVDWPAFVRRDLATLAAVFGPYARAVGDISEAGATPAADARLAQASRALNSRATLSAEAELAHFGESSCPRVTGRR